MERKIFEIIQDLNSQLQEKIQGKKFEYGELHDIIRTKIKCDELDYTVWNYSLKSRFTEVLKLDVESTDDKRMRHKRVGVIDNIYVKPCNGIDINMTIEENIFNIEKLKLKREIQACEHRIEDLKNKILESENKIEGLKKKLDDMESIEKSEINE